MNAEQTKRQADIIANGTDWDAFEFARDVDGADVEALRAAFPAAESIGKGARE